MKKIFKSALLAVLLMAAACSEENPVSNSTESPAKTRARQEVLIDEEVQQFGIAHNMYMDHALELTNNLYDIQYAGIRSDEELINFSIQDYDTVIDNYLSTYAANTPDALSLYGGATNLNISNLSTYKVTLNIIESYSQTQLREDIHNLTVAGIIGYEENQIFGRLLDLYYFNHNDDEFLIEIDDCISAYNEASALYSTRAISNDLALVTPVISIASASTDWWMADESQPYIEDGLHAVIAADIIGAIVGAVAEGIEQYVENGEVNDYGKIGRHALYGAVLNSANQLFFGMPKGKFPWKF